MLEGSFFSILEVREIEGEKRSSGDPVKYRIILSLNPEHPIYEGHFPGNPVVPGVCQIRIVTEVVSEIKRKKLMLLEGDAIKFLQMINPAEHQELTLDCTLQETGEDRLKVASTISAGETVFFKAKLLYA